MTNTLSAKTPAMNYTTAKHDARLDIIRIVALFFVILIHCVESNWDLGSFGMSQLSTPMQIFVIVLYSIGRLSVPLFLFLTGYLMLDRNYKAAEILPFYKKKVVRLLTTTELWIVIYYMFYIAMGWSDFSLIALIKQMIFLNSSILAPHMWYMPMIIGIYLFIPFISKALQIITSKVAVIILAIASFYLFIIPTINSLLAANGIDTLSSQLDISYVGGIYGVYMLVGYLCKKYWNTIKRKLSNAKLLVTFFISFVCIVVVHYVAVVVLKYRYSTWYDSFWVLVASASLFMLLLRLLGGIKGSSMVEYVSKSVFGIYLIHYLFIYIINVYINKMLINSSTILGFVLLMTVTIVLSSSMCFIAKKYKWIGKITKVFGFA